MIDPKQAGQQAEELFYKGYNCCESVITMMAEAFGKRCPECIPALGTGMGGGVGHTGHVCGAVTGGAMAIGLASTLKKLKDHGAEKQWAIALATELVDAFEREFSSVECGTLLGMDLRAADAAERYRAGRCKEKCGHFVNFVGEWLARRLAEENL